MSAAAVAGAAGALALIAAIRSVFPARPSLYVELGRFGASGYTAALPEQQGRVELIAMRLLVQAKGGDLSGLQANIRVSGTTVATFAEDKLKSAVAGGLIVASFGFVVGVVSSPVGVLVAAVIGFVLGYSLPDQELKKKSASRRETFTRALNSFVTLVAVSISGGAGINSALAAAASLGDSWVFEEITQALHEAEVRGTSPWTELEELGRELDIRPLVELAGALNLAGTDGAKVTESLYARADSGRSKELTDVRAKAEGNSSSLGLPVGCMLLGFAGFMGFAALSNLTGL